MDPFAEIPPADSELENAEWNAQIDDLSEKIKRDFVEGRYPLETVFCSVLSTVVDLLLQYEDPNWALRRFIAELGPRFDGVMEDIESGEASNEAGEEDA